MTNIVLYKDTLSNDDLTKHRAWIAVKAQALMGRYFQLPQDDLVKRDILLGWMDMLQNCTQDEITDACKIFLKQFPRTRPHEGHIYNIVIKERQKNKPPRCFEIEEIEAGLHNDQEWCDRNLSTEERRRIAKEVLGKWSKK